MRFCVDYRKLNVVTKHDYSLPRLTGAIYRLQEAEYFTTLEFLYGYWQVKLTPTDADKSAFIISYGLYQFTRLPFRLCNAPASFQCLKDRILGHLRWTMALVYSYNIVIYFATFQEHLRRLTFGVDALHQANLHIKPEMCFFGLKLVLYLGHVVNKNGIKSAQPT